MWKPRYGTCTVCHKQRLLVVSKLLCKKCNDERKSLKNPKKENRNKGSARNVCTNGLGRRRGNRILLPQNKSKKGKAFVFKKSKPILYRKTRIGEKQVFLEIWSERSHICQVCSKGLGEEPLAQFFSHILSKGRYPKLKLDKRNIWLCCFECHYEWEFSGKSYPKFAEKNKIAEMLKIEYNQNKL